MTANTATLLFVAYSVIAIASCLNFDITNLSNCPDEKIDYQKESDIEIKDVIYEKNEKGFSDTFHGKYVVHVHDMHHDSEFVLIFYSCPPGSKGTCTENPKEFTEMLNCDRFLTDSTGPWYAFAPAMDKRNMCATLTGEYEFNRAHMNGTFVEKYMDVKEGHYRIKGVHHVPGADMSTKNMRSCVEIDFDIYA